VSVPVFIPFMGALITMKQMPPNAWREARFAIAAAARLCGRARPYLLGIVYDSQHLKALAFLGFLINLFNLLPVIPLDGGRITAALHPALWLLGFLGLLALVIYQPNPILIIILLLAGSELWRPLAGTGLSRDEAVLPGASAPAGDHGVPLLRARRRSRARHARNARAAQLLENDRLTCACRTFGSAKIKSR
jgi:Zn-dependent protease